MKRVCIVGYGRAGRLQHAALNGIFEVARVVDERASIAQSLDDPSLFTTSLENALADSTIDAVVVCTPTRTHYEVTRTALEHDKHVFLEKPIANTTTEIERLYKLAEERGRLLFVAFNRRYDPEWTRVRDTVGASPDSPLFINVLCRDHPFPPAAYLETCGGIFRDAAVHDLDMLCLMLDDTPVEVHAVLDEAAENGSIFLTFSRGCRAHVVHSRHAPGYDQRVTVVLRDRVVEMGREENASEEGQTFQTRYRESYVRQMQDFRYRLHTCDHAPNISLSHALMLERVVDACDLSARDRTLKKI